MFKKIITGFLVWEAKLAIQKNRPKVIGITGSSGKSSTKEAVWCVLNSKFNARKSIKSYNSELGLALAVLGLKTAWHSPMGWLSNIYEGAKEAFNKNFPKILVLEMGVDRPRDLEKLTKIARPSIAVVTALGEIPVHVEFFSSAEEVAREKSKIIKSLPASGHAVLNFDDSAVLDMKEKTEAHIITYGFGEGANIRASNYKISPEGISFKLDFEGASVPVRLKDVFGKHYVYSALAAASVGTILDMNLIEIAEALNLFKLLPGRLNLLEGIKGSRILDDSYNASPLATHAALDTLAELDAKRKIVVFGDMLEIGKFTIPAHKAVGNKVAQVAQYFITVGPRSKFAAEEAIASGMDKKTVNNFSTSSEAAGFVKELIEEGDLILVKGSQSMRMERVTEEIMAHPEEASKLLCRQDEFWRRLS